MNRILLLTVLLGVLPEVIAGSPNSLDELLDQVRQDRLVERDHNIERERRFLADRDRQRAGLAEVQAQQDRAEAQAEGLRSEFEQYEGKLSSLGDQLKERTGDMNTLFAAVRQIAADARNTVANSLVSAQLPGRTAFLDQLGQDRQPPTIEDLEGLWMLLLEEMNESGKIRRFKASVITADGEQSEQQITRIGTFNAVSQGHYLKLLAEADQLVELARQPSLRLQSMARELERSSEGIHAVAIDPSRGAILGLMVQSPDLLERIQQGGIIAYLILILGGVGLLIVIERYAVLVWIRHKVARQLSGHGPSTNNPLARIENIVRKDEYVTMENLAAQLDEGVAEEAHRLQRGLPTLAILAAVTPLLGLLGTVTGMIETFQTITLFGTGDPRLMSGGISQALVTTQLGLAVAIPVLLMHSFLNGRANRLIETLDQQSTVLLTDSTPPAATVDG
ncbi:MAG: MotA/TolQ/ExbB proton channel family protein [Pseudomonadota bacterium]